VEYEADKGSTQVDLNIMILMACTICTLDVVGFLLAVKKCYLRDKKNKILYNYDKQVLRMKVKEDPELMQTQKEALKKSVLKRFEDERYAIQKVTMNIWLWWVIWICSWIGIIVFLSNIAVVIQQA
jgi:hypothetical protein